jgi:hypothetical protein
MQPSYGATEAEQSHRAFSCASYTLVIAGGVHERPRPMRSAGCRLPTGGSLVREGGFACKCDAGETVLVTLQ